MEDDRQFPTAAELERFREEITRELKLTRDEVRQAFQEAAEPLKTQLPAILDHIARLEERVRELEAQVMSERWRRRQIN
ncbi:MAG TPA: hypothetical protein VMG40_08240 [Bryobacteraceae bacterium]|nr:hypothetical protein [Bryobacteraceae bacterium]